MLQGLSLLWEAEAASMTEAFKEAGPLKVICRRSLRVNHGLPLNYRCREPPLLTWRPDPVDLRRLPCTLFSPLDYVFSLLIIIINLVTRPYITNGISVLRGWRTAHAVFYKLKPLFWNPNQQLTCDLGQKLYWLLIQLIWGKFS